MDQYKEVLSEEMKEAILLAAKGETSDSSARILGVGWETVRYRLRCAIAILGARNICNAVAISVSHGLIDFDSKKSETKT